MSWLDDIIYLAAEPVDTLIDGLTTLPDAELTQFALAAHNLRHAAMAALGRRAPELWDEMDRLFRTRYRIPAFHFTEQITGGVILPADRTGGSAARSNLQPTSCLTIFDEEDL